MERTGFPVSVCRAVSAPRRRTLAPRWITLVLLLLGVMPVSGQEPSAVSADDEVATVFQAYLDFSDSTQSLPEEEKRRQFQEWLDVLLQLARDHPESPLYQRLLFNAGLLSNTLGQWRKTMEIAELALACDDLSDWDRLHWNWELGQVAEHAFVVSRGADREAQAIGVAACDRVIAQLEQNEARSVKDDELLLDVFAWNGSLLLHRKADAAEIARAADYFVKGRAHYQKVAARVGDVWSNEETFLVGEAKARLRLGDIDRTIECLLALGKIPTAKQTPSRIGADIVHDVDQNLGREFLIRWCEVAPQNDRSRIMCEFLLAIAYFDQPNDAAAIVAHERLRDERAAALLELDGEWAAEGRGGNYATVLRNLETLYRRAGRFDDALATSAEFLRLYPNYGKEADNLEQQRPWVEQQAQRARSQEQRVETSSSSLYWVVGTVNAVLVAGFSIAYWRSRRRSPEPAGETAGKR